MSWFSLSIKREILLSYRRGLECATPLLFFIIVSLLFPLATVPSPALLKTMGPGVILIALLLANLLALNHLFRDDYNDGSLIQWVLAPLPLPLLILSKVLAQWVILSFPLVLISPLLAMMFQLSLHAICVLFVSLVLGSLTLNLMGAIMAALTVGLRNSGLLMALILLPLTIPSLIFASHAVSQAEAGLSMIGPLSFLAASLVFSLVFAPLISAFALRVGVAYD